MPSRSPKAVKGLANAGESRGWVGLLDLGNDRLQKIQITEQLLRIESPNLLRQCLNHLINFVSKHARIVGRHHPTNHAVQFGKLCRQPAWVQDVQLFAQNIEQDQKLLRLRSGIEMIDQRSQAIHRGFHIIHQFICQLRDQSDHAVEQGVRLLGNRFGIERLQKIFGVAGQLRQRRGFQRYCEPVKSCTVIAASLGRGLVRKSPHRVKGVLQLSAQGAGAGLADCFQRNFQ